VHGLPKGDFNHDAAFAGAVTHSESHTARCSYATLRAACAVKARTAVLQGEAGL
jgi:hypothetical protein